MKSQFTTFEEIENDVRKFDKQSFEEKEIIEPSKEQQTTLPGYTSQDWHKYNLAKTNEKRLFYELLSELCSLIPEPHHEKGRKPLRVRDLIFMSCLKLYCGYSLRKINWDIKEAEKCGYIKRAAHFNAVSRFFCSEGTYDLLQKLLVITALPLKELEDHYSMDASGFGSYEKDRWVRVRFNSARKMEWRKYLKGHVAIGTRTNIICTAEITNGNYSDCKQAPRLLEDLKHFNPKEVSADKAYSSKRVFQIVQSLGAMPYIPFKSTTTRENKKAPKIWNRMFRYFSKHRESFLQHYHKRSNVETTFAMIKMRLGEFLKSKSYEAQRNELMIKFIVHNITVLVQEIFEREVHIDFKEGIVRILNK